MNTGDLCTREVVTVTPQSTLPEVARAMRRGHVGSVVVVSPADPKQPIGIVTDRDIVLETLAADLDPRTVTASEIMSRTLVTAAESDDAAWSLKVMRDRGIRRLPVVDAQGKLSGIIALDDLLHDVASVMCDVVQTIGTERVVEARTRNAAA